MKLRSIRMAALSAMLVLFVGASLPSRAADSHPPMKNGPIMTAKEARELIATAKTAKDHLKLARYFNEEAVQYEVEAKTHEEMEAAYRANPLPKNLGGSGPIYHCELLIKSNREMASAAREMAAAHEGMANEVAK